MGLAEGVAVGATVGEAVGAIVAVGATVAVEVGEGLADVAGVKTASYVKVLPYPQVTFAGLIEKTKLSIPEGIVGLGMPPIICPVSGSTM